MAILARYTYTHTHRKQSVEFIVCVCERKFIKAVKHTINRPTSEPVSPLFEMNDALACNMLKKHQYNQLCLCVCMGVCMSVGMCGVVVVATRQL